MKQLFEIDNITLDNLEMSRYNLISNLEYQQYFTETSSKEHYRLLTYISNQFNGESFIDIGTLKGCSALALSTNLSNKVYSFNLSEQKELNTIPENCEFILDDISNGLYDELILNSKIILLDTFHDGTFELKFYNHLKSINYKGYLLLDDIKLNNEMVEFWNQIELEKQDLTHIGHASGTGVVYFQ
jgi:predicted O-methyltransferase YrrM